MSYEPDFHLDWTLPSGLTLEICKHEEWLLFSDLIINREYWFGAEYLLQKKKPVSFIDLGANVGFASWYLSAHLLSAKQQFKGLLVEPNPETFVELERRVESQRKVFGESFLVPIHGMVGKPEGKAYLRIDGCHTVSRAYDQPEAKGIYLETPYLPLEDYLDKDEPIDLIKCDIEGSELDFVIAYPELLQRTGCFIAELHPPDDRKEWLRELLKDNGLVNTKVLRVAGNVSTEAFWR